MIIYYITIAYRSMEEPDVDCGDVAARSKAEAIQFSIDNYRKSRNLPASIHVNVRVLNETEDPRRSADFYDQLMEKIHEEKTN